MLTAQFEMQGGHRRGECDYEFYGPPRGPVTGNFFSPFYPQNYPSNSRCTYLFIASSTKYRVKVLFRNIQLETSNAR